MELTESFNMEGSVNFSPSAVQKRRSVSVPTTRNLQLLRRLSNSTNIPPATPWTPAAGQSVAQTPKTPAPPPGALSWTFFLSIFLDMTTVALVMPLLPQFVEALDISKANLGFVQALYGITQAFSTPVLGMLSDAVGARPILMLSLIGSSLSFGILSLSVVFNSIAVFYFSRFFIGALRQTVAVGAAIVTSIYAAGVSEGELRRRAAAKGMSWFSFSTSFAFCIGPAVGGILADHIGIVNVGYVGTALGMANAVLMYYSVPPSALRGGGNDSTANSPSGGANSSSAFDTANAEEEDQEETKAPPTKKGLLERRTPVGFAIEVFKERSYKSYLLLAALMSSLAWAMVSTSIAPLLKEVSRYQYSSSSSDSSSSGGSDGGGGPTDTISMTTVGTIFSSVGGCYALTQFLLPKLLRRFYSFNIALGAMLGSLLGYLLQCASYNYLPTLVTGMILSACCAGIADTVNKSTFSSAFSADSSGEVMAVIYSMDGFNRVIAPLVWGALSAKKGLLPNIQCFLSVGVVVLAAALYFFKVRPSLRDEQKKAKKK